MVAVVVVAAPAAGCVVVVGVFLVACVVLVVLVVSAAAVAVDSGSGSGCGFGMYWLFGGVGGQIVFGFAFIVIIRVLASVIWRATRTCAIVGTTWYCIFAYLYIYIYGLRSIPPCICALLYYCGASNRF